MPRLKNSLTDVVVNVDEATAATLPAEWKPVESGRKAPAKATAKAAEKK